MSNHPETPDSSDVPAEVKRGRKQMPEWVHWEWLAVGIILGFELALGVMAMTARRRR